MERIESGDEARLRGTSSAHRGRVESPRRLGPNGPIDSWCWFAPRRGSMMKKKVIEIADQQPGEIDAVVSWVRGRIADMAVDDEGEVAAEAGVPLMACLRGLECHLRELAEDMRKADESHISIDGQWYEPPTVCEFYPPDGADKRMTRWIGPIPSRYLEPVDDGSEAIANHRGGHAPRWGGYRPVLYGDMVVPHSLGRETRLLPVRRIVAGGAPVLEWFVSAPSQRVSRQCVRIATDAMDELGHSQVAYDMLLAAGIGADEIAIACSQKGFR